MLMQLNSFDSLMFKDRYLIFLKQFRITHIRMMLQILFAEFLTTDYIFGYESMSQTFDTFATESGRFSSGTAFHRLAHLEYSSKAFLKMGRSSHYSWITSSIL